MTNIHLVYSRPEAKHLVTTAEEFHKAQNAWFYSYCKMWCAVFGMEMK